MLRFIVLCWILGFARGVYDARICARMPRNTTMSYLKCLYESSGGEGRKTVRELAAKHLLSILGGAGFELRTPNLQTRNVSPNLKINATSAVISRPKKYIQRETKKQGTTKKPTSTSASPQPIKHMNHLSFRSLPLSLIINETKPHLNLRSNRWTQGGAEKHLAILVPFQNNFRELLTFVPHMHQFLNARNILFHIFIIQQTDNKRFNKASLINIGFLQTKNYYDYIAIHDIDLLPKNNNVSYEYPTNGPVHFISPLDFYNIGGVLLMTIQDFAQVDGMANEYWESQIDYNEFYLRLREANLVINKIQNMDSNIFTKIGVNYRQLREQEMCNMITPNEYQINRDIKTGVHDVNFKLRGAYNITINDLPVTLIDVELICDFSMTPWCRCTDPETIKVSKVQKRNQEDIPLFL